MDNTNITQEAINMGSEGVGVPVLPQNVTPSNDKKTIWLVVFGCLVAVAICLVIAIVIVHISRSVVSSGPSLELAKSVCAKYRGDMWPTNDSNYRESYNCTGEKDTAMFLSNGTQFIVYFFDDSEKDEVWSNLRTTISDSEGHEDVSGYVILENSDDFIKAYYTMAGLVRIYTVAYDNAVALISVQSDSAAEKMIAELGFPNGKRADNFKEY